MFEYEVVRELRSEVIFLKKFLYLNGALFRICRALFSICRALFRIYGALLEYVLLEYVLLEYVLLEYVWRFQALH